ncbi:MAG: glycosyltransferase [Nitrososphaerota archaeon]|jgi:GT2 family glycosyltransferase|uniref:glycosyltransferase family 2 protein n=1 Tax=Candidatus Bathycorpusculum sp. TaxID=2994959 RepID=UPI00282292FB|nr:glycosyltransferase [Candidatus Termiticorpusculum sp.]MCL2257753.1 glycosyltransferase [Candidatus Termiticorpusculum sp.]MCL2292114.1 glycosyltransferase [Candidatus Termiticorpusculum sp.]MDR0461484.1 glycosyltransferase [Nitrososphaerota archaeon]
MTYSCEVLTPLGGTGIPTTWTENNKKWLKNYTCYTSTIKGIGQARNELLKTAQAPLVLWLDSDVELEFDPVPALFEIMQKFNAAGVCTGQLTVGRKWFLQVAAEIDKLEIERYGGLKIVESRAFQCGLYKREDLLKVDGFDSTFDIAGEDNDIVRRMIAQGLLVLQCNKIIVKHHVNEQTYWHKFKGYHKGFSQLAATMKPQYQPETQRSAIDFSMLKRMPLKYPLYKLREKLSLK